MYNAITGKELKSLIGKVHIIDIRDNYLYRLSSIPTAINIPINYLLLDPSKYLDKEQTYYIYCSFGMSSGKVCSMLVKDGYNVVNVMGGFNDYLE